MKILFLSLNNNWTPHFDTELELMVKHKNQNDEVFVLCCGKNLSICASHPKKSIINCIRCQARFREGMRLVGVSSNNILKMSFFRRFFVPNRCFATVDELEQFSWKGVNLGKAIVSTLVSHVQDHKPDKRLLEGSIHRHIQTAISVYESMCTALKKIKPDIVYIFNGRFSDVAPAVSACKQCNIRFFTHERGSNTKMYDLFENSFPHSLIGAKKRYNDLWDDSCSSDKKMIAEQWFKERAQGKELEWYSYTKTQAKGRLPLLFDLSRLNIAIFNSSIDESCTFDEWKNPIYQNEVAALRQIFNEMQANTAVCFYVRVHPHLKGRNNSQIKELKKIEQEFLLQKNVHFIWPEDLVDSYALLKACEKIITFGSTMGVEACYWRKPSILIGRAYYEDLDCCYIPRNHNEVVDLLSRPLLPKDIIGALKYGYRHAAGGIPFEFFEPDGFCDGKFMGEKIVGKFNLVDKIQLKLLELLQIR